ncbi:MAG: hypothetical protein ABJD68_16330 [Nakamurella sp.]
MKYPSTNSALAERLWDELSQARGAKSSRPVADLEDAAFRLYLPMARTLARSVDQPADLNAAEQAAELGLARAILAWRHRSSVGFRVFARSVILRQLQRP